MLTMELQYNRNSAPDEVRKALEKEGKGGKRRAK